MGYAGLPLGIASSMFSALAIGVGVDFALHLSHAYGRPSTTQTDRDTARVRIRDSKEVENGRWVRGLTRPLQFFCPAPSHATLEKDHGPASKSGSTDTKHGGPRWQ